MTTKSGPTSGAENTQFVKRPIVMSFSEGVFHCKVCVNNTESRNAFEEHMAAHIQSHPYVCIQCKTTYRLNIEMDEHVRSVHKNEKVQCGLKGMKVIGKFMDQLMQKGILKFKGYDREKAESPSFTTGVSTTQGNMDSKPDSENNLTKMNIPIMKSEVSAESITERTQDRGTVHENQGYEKCHHGEVDGKLTEKEDEADDRNASEEQGSKTSNVSSAAKTTVTPGMRETDSLQGESDKTLEQALKQSDLCSVKMTAVGPDMKERDSLIVQGYSGKAEETLEQVYDPEIGERHSGKVQDESDKTVESVDNRSVENKQETKKIDNEFATSGSKNIGQEVSNLAQPRVSDSADGRTDLETLPELGNLTESTVKEQAENDFDHGIHNSKNHPEQQSKDNEVVNGTESQSENSLDRGKNCQENVTGESVSQFHQHLDGILSSAHITPMSNVLEKEEQAQIASEFTAHTGKMLSQTKAHSSRDILPGVQNEELVSYDSTNDRVEASCLPSSTEEILRTTANVLSNEDNTSETPAGQETGIDRFIANQTSLDLPSVDSLPLQTEGGLSTETIGMDPPSVTEEDLFDVPLQADQCSSAELAIDTSRPDTFSTKENVLDVAVQNGSTKEHLSEMPHRDQSSSSAEEMDLPESISAEEISTVMHSHTVGEGKSSTDNKMPEVPEEKEPNLIKQNSDFSTAKHTHVSDLSTTQTGGGCSLDDVDYAIPVVIENKDKEKPIKDIESAPSLLVADMKEDLSTCANSTGIVAVSPDVLANKEFPVEISPDTTLIVARRESSPSNLTQDKETIVINLADKVNSVSSGQVENDVLGTEKAMYGTCKDVNLSKGTDNAKKDEKLAKQQEKLLETQAGNEKEEMSGNKETSDGSFTSQLVSPGKCPVTDSTQQPSSSQESDLQAISDANERVLEANCPAVIRSSTKHVKPTKLPFRRIVSIGKQFWESVLPEPVDVAQFTALSTNEKSSKVMVNSTSGPEGSAKKHVTSTTGQIEPLSSKSCTLNKSEKLTTLKPPESDALRVHPGISASVGQQISKVFDERDPAKKQSTSSTNVSGDSLVTFLATPSTVSASQVQSQLGISTSVGQQAIQRHSNEITNVSMDRNLSQHTEKDAYAILEAHERAMAEKMSVFNLTPSRQRIVNSVATTNPRGSERNQSQASGHNVYQSTGETRTTLVSRLPPTQTLHALPQMQPTGVLPQVQNTCVLSQQANPGTLPQPYPTGTFMAIVSTVSSGSGNLNTAMSSQVRIEDNRLNQQPTRPAGDTPQILNVPLVNFPGSIPAFQIYPRAILQQQSLLSQSNTSLMGQATTQHLIRQNIPVHPGRVLPQQTNTMNVQSQHLVQQQSGVLPQTMGQESMPGMRMMLYGPGAPSLGTIRAPQPDKPRMPQPGPLASSSSNMITTHSGMSVQPSQRSKQMTESMIARSMQVQAMMMMAVGCQTQPENETPAGNEIQQTMQDQAAVRPGGDVQNPTVCPTTRTQPARAGPQNPLHGMRETSPTPVSSRNVTTVSQSENTGTKKKRKQHLHERNVVEDSNGNGGIVQGKDGKDSDKDESFTGSRISKQTSIKLTSKMAELFRKSREEKQKPNSDKGGTPETMSTGENQPQEIVPEKNVKRPPKNKGTFRKVGPDFLCNSCKTETTSESEFRKHIWSHFHAMRVLCSDCDTSDESTILTCPLVMSVMDGLKFGCSVGSSVVTEPIKEEPKQDDDVVVISHRPATKRRKGNAIKEEVSDELPTKKTVGHSATKKTVYALTPVRTPEVGTKNQTVTVTQSTSVDHRIYTVNAVEKDNPQTSKAPTVSVVSTETKDSNTIKVTKATVVQPVKTLAIVVPPATTPTTVYIVPPPRNNAGNAIRQTVLSVRSIATKDNRQSKPEEVRTGSSFRKGTNTDKDTERAVVTHASKSATGDKAPADKDICQMSGNLEVTAPRSESAKSKDGKTSPVMEGNGNFYICGGFDNCRFSCMTSTAFQKHLSSEHKDAVRLMCFHCGHFSTTPKGLICHLHSHIKAKSITFKCCVTNCRFQTNSVHEYEYHLYEYHVAKCQEQLTNFSCTSCCEKFPCVGELIKHLRKNMLKFVLCPHCKMKDTDSKLIKNHIALEHSTLSRMVTVACQLVCLARGNNHFNATPTTSPVSTAPVPTAQTASTEHVAGALRKDAPSESGDSDLPQPSEDDESSEEPEDDQAKNREPTQKPELRIVASQISACDSTVSLSPTPSHNPLAADESKTEDAASLSNISTSTMLHKCSLCSFATRGKLPLRTHEKIHGIGVKFRETKVFVCPICPDGMSTIKLFREHMMCHIGNHIVTMYYCDVCQIFTNKKEDIVNHGKRYHNNFNEETAISTRDMQISFNAFSCDICDYCTTSQEIFQKHVKSHVTEKHTPAGLPEELKCPYCIYHTTNEEHFRVHVTNQHKKQLNWEKRNKRVSSEVQNINSTASSVTSADESKDQPTSPPDKSENTSDQLRDQNDEQSSSTPNSQDQNPESDDEYNSKVMNRYHCCECSKCFSTQKHLYTHLQSHGRVTKKKYHVTMFTCQFCKYSSTERSWLKRHHVEKHQKRTKPGTTKCQVPDMEPSSSSQGDNAAKKSYLPTPVIPDKKAFLIPTQTTFPQPVQCSECDFSSRDRAKLIIHVSKHATLYPSFENADDTPEKEVVANSGKLKEVAKGSNDEKKRESLIRSSSQSSEISGNEQEVIDLLTDDSSEEDADDDKGLEKVSDENEKVPKQNMDKSKTKSADSEVQAAEVRGQRKSKDCASIYRLGGDLLHIKLKPCFREADNHTFICELCDNNATFNTQDQLHKHILVHMKLWFFMCVYCDFHSLEYGVMSSHQTKFHSKMPQQVLKIEVEDFRNRVNEVIHCRKAGVSLTDCNATIPQKPDAKWKKINNDDSSSKTSAKAAKPRTSKTDKETASVLGSDKSLTVQKKRRGTVVKVGAFHKCTLCGYKSTNCNVVTRHMQLHSQENKDHCHLCAFQSSVKGDLQLHLEKRHPETRTIKPKEMSKTSEVDQYLSFTPEKVSVAESTSSASAVKSVTSKPQKSRDVVRDEIGSSTDKKKKSVSKNVFSKTQKPEIVDKVKTTKTEIFFSHQIKRVNGLRKCLFCRHTCKWRSNMIRHIVNIHKKTLITKDKLKDIEVVSDEESNVSNDDSSSTNNSSGANFSDDNSSDDDTSVDSSSDDSNKPKQIVYTCDFRANKDGQFPCKLCDSILKYKGNMNRHYMDVHQADIREGYVCAGCRKPFQLMTQFLKHLAAGTSCYRPWYLCPGKKCSLMSFNENKIKKHISKDHSFQKDADELKTKKSKLEYCLVKAALRKDEDDGQKKKDQLGSRNEASSQKEKCPNRPTSKGSKDVTTSKDSKSSKGKVCFSTLPSMRNMECGDCDHVSASGRVFQLHCNRIHAMKSLQCFYCKKFATVSVRYMMYHTLEAHRRQVLKIYRVDQQPSHVKMAQKFSVACQKGKINNSKLVTTNRYYYWKDLSKMNSNTEVRKDSPGSKLKDVKTDLDVDYYRCVAVKDCGMTSRKKEDMFTHIQKHLNYKPYKCGHCGLLCTKDEYVRMHHTKVHAVDNKTSKVIVSRKDMVEQKIAELVKRGIVKSSAGTDEGPSGVTIMELTEEEKSTHKNGPSKLFSAQKTGKRIVFQCRRCSFSSESQTLIVSHVYTHFPQFYRCPFCTMTAYPRSYVVEHMTKVHPKEDRNTPVINLLKVPPTSKDGDDSSKTSKDGDDSSAQSSGTDDSSEEDTPQKNRLRSRTHDPTPDSESDDDGSPPKPKTVSNKKRPMMSSEGKSSDSEDSDDGKPKAKHLIKRRKVLASRSESDVDSDDKEEEADVVRRVPQKRRRPVFNSDSSSGTITDFGPTRHFCHQCMYRTEDLRAYCCHLVTHGGFSQLCSLPFADNSIKPDGELWRSDGILFKCTYCEFLTIISFRMKQHVITNHPDKFVDYTEIRTKHQRSRITMVDLQPVLKMTDICRMDLMDLATMLRREGVTMSSERHEQGQKDETSDVPKTENSEERKRKKFSIMLPSKYYKKSESHKDVHDKGDVESSKTQATDEGMNDCEEPDLESGEKSEHDGNKNSAGINIRNPLNALLNLACISSDEPPQAFDNTMMEYMSAELKTGTTKETETSLNGKTSAGESCMATDTHISMSEELLNARKVGTTSKVDSSEKIVTMTTQMYEDISECSDVSDSGHFDTDKTLEDLDATLSPVDDGKSKVTSSQKGRGAKSAIYEDISDCSDSILSKNDNLYEDVSDADSDHDNRLLGLPVGVRYTRNVVQVSGGRDVCTCEPAPGNVENHDRGGATGDPLISETVHVDGKFEAHSSTTENVKRSSSHSPTTKNDKLSTSPDEGTGSALIDKGDTSVRSSDKESNFLKSAHSPRYVEITNDNVISSIDSLLDSLSDIRQTRVMDTPSESLSDSHNEKNIGQTPVTRITERLPVSPHGTDIGQTGTDILVDSVAVNNTGEQAHTKLITEAMPSSEMESLSSLSAESTRAAVTPESESSVLITLSETTVTMATQPSEIIQRSEVEAILPSEHETSETTAAMSTESSEVIKMPEAGSSELNLQSEIEPSNMSATLATESSQAKSSEPTETSEKLATMATESSEMVTMSEAESSEPTETSEKIATMVTESSEMVTMSEAESLDKTETSKTIATMVTETSEMVTMSEAESPQPTETSEKIATMFTESSEMVKMTEAESSEQTETSEKKIATMVTETSEMVTMSEAESSYETETSTTMATMVTETSEMVKMTEAESSEQTETSETIATMATESSEMITISEAESSEMVKMSEAGSSEDFALEKISMINTMETEPSKMTTSLCTAEISDTMKTFDKETGCATVPRMETVDETETSSENTELHDQSKPQMADETETTASMEGANDATGTLPSVKEWMDVQNRSEMSEDIGQVGTVESPKISGNLGVAECSDHRGVSHKFDNVGSSDRPEMSDSPGNVESSDRTYNSSQVRALDHPQLSDELGQIGSTDCSDSRPATSAQYSDLHVSPDNSELVESQQDCLQDSDNESIGFEMLENETQGF